VTRSAEAGHNLHMEMRKRAVMLGVAALVLLGTGFVLGRISLGEGPEPRALSPAPVQAASVRVPDVTGLTLGPAVDVLTSLGLRVDEQALRARPDPQTQGAILSQGVPVGSQVDVGETVPLVLSAGPHPHLVVVGGQRRVFVGGTCELMPTVRLCVGGPLFVALVEVWISAPEASV
jgi:hypothetical protein